MKATEGLRYGDHIGGLVYNTAKTLHEPTANGLRAYFTTKDEKWTLYIHEAEVK